MSENKEQQAEKNLENVEVALTKTEQFFENNQRPIAVGALAIVAIVALVWIVNSFYIQPRKADSQREIFNAQYYFEADSFALALNGDGQNAGFLDIINEYGSTPAGKLASYYAGVCNLKLGNYEEAKKHLKNFSSDDETLNAFAEGLIGDIESQLGNNAAAITAYQKATNSKNKVAAPIFLEKLGVAYEVAGDKAKAKQAYQTIKDEYPSSAQASAAEKYLNAVGE